MSRVTAHIAACECRCRRTLFRAQVYNYGVRGAYLQATYDLEIGAGDQDCDGRSGENVSTGATGDGFERTIPINTEACVAFGPVYIHVHTPPSSYPYHYGWIVEADDETESIIFTQVPANADLILDLEKLGGLAVVTGLFSDVPLGDEGADIVQQCSEDLLFPSHVLVTLPATLDFGDFNQFDSDPERKCPVNGPPAIWRSHDTFNRQGPADLVVACRFTSPGISHLPQMVAFSPITATYTYETPSGVCLRIHLISFWTHCDENGDFCGNAPSRYIAVGGCAVELILIDQNVQSEFDAAEHVVAAPVAFVSLKKISDPYTSQALCAVAGDFGGCSSVGNLIGPYPVASPVTIVAAQSFLDALGESESWYNFTAFVLDHRSSNSVLCDSSVRSDISGLFAECLNAGETHITFPIEVEGTTPATNPTGDCLCLEGDGVDPATARSSNVYLADDSSLSSESCELSCTYDGYTVDVFPKTIDLGLPDEIDFTPFRSAACNSSTGHTALTSSAIGTGLLTRDATLAKSYLLGGSCASPLAERVSVGSDGLSVFGAVFLFCNTAESPNHHFALGVPYAPNLTGTCPNYNTVELFAGYFSSAAPGEPADQVRFFTQCCIEFTIKRGATENRLLVYSVNLGPLVDINGMSEAAIMEYFELANGLWVPNWEFDQFCIAFIIDGNQNADTDAGCVGSTPSGANVWHCPMSVHPNIWLMGEARVKHNAPTLVDFCGDCTVDPIDADQWTTLCYGQHGGNVLVDFQVEPVFGDSSDVDCDDPVRFIQYNAPV